MKLDYVFDLHTASAGRQNSLYVRADMNVKDISEMATDLSPQIIVHNSSPGGSLRGCAQRNGINALTIEVCSRVIDACFNDISDTNYSDWKSQHFPA